MTLEQAVAAPRVAPSQPRRLCSAEQGFLDRYGAALSGSVTRSRRTGPRHLGRRDRRRDRDRVRPGRALTAVAEPTRRGGGAARVVDPK